MLRLVPAWLWGLLLATFVGVVSINVYSYGGLVVQRKWDAEKLARAEATKKAREQQETELKQAQNLHDALVARVVRLDSELDQQRKEKQDALRRQTTGKPCFSPAVVRLLNDEPPPRLPAAGDDPSGQPAAGADAGEAPTDTDVAFWIEESKALYARCSERLSVWQTLYKDNQLCR